MELEGFKKPLAVGLL